MKFTFIFQWESYSNIFLIQIMQLNDFMKQTKIRARQRIRNPETKNQALHEPLVCKNLKPNCKSQQEWTR